MTEDGVMRLEALRFAMALGGDPETQIIPAARVFLDFLNGEAAVESNQPEQSA